MIREPLQRARERLALYEADGFGSASVAFFEIDKAGKKVWETKIPVPYCGLLHDFAVTENYVVFYVIPMKIDTEQMEKALKKAGVPVESLYFPNEGHGFYTEPHQREFYTKLLGFLSRHLGGAAAK